MGTVYAVLKMLGCLGMFLYGMSLMSGGLQKMVGDSMRSFLASMTSNRFKCVLTGIVITALVQSSTATTLMLVSFVNAGLLALANAIGVIMGANIGTTDSLALRPVLRRVLQPRCGGHPPYVLCLRVPLPQEDQIQEFR